MGGRYEAESGGRIRHSDSRSLETLPLQDMSIILQMMTNEEKC